MLKPTAKNRRPCTPAKRDARSTKPRHNQTSAKKYVEADTGEDCILLYRVTITDAAAVKHRASPEKPCEYNSIHTTEVAVSTVAFRTSSPPPVTQWCPPPLSPNGETVDLVFGEVAHQHIAQLHVVPVNLLQSRLCAAHKKTNPGQTSEVREERAESDKRAAQMHENHTS